MMSVRSNWPVSLLVDAEVGGELHRAAHALRHVHERAVGEHRRVERGVEVVALRHHRAQVLLHQLGMLAHRLRDGAEDDAGLGQLRLEGGDDGDAVEHGIDRHPGAVDAGQHLALLERDAELLVGAQQLRVDLVEALGPLGRLGRGVVIEVLEVDPGILDVGPRRLRHAEPAVVGLEPPLQHPAGLALLLRDEADGALVEPLRRLDRLDVGLEAVLVLVDVDPLDLVDRLLNCGHFLSLRS